jgi:hypothetical protein
MVLKNIKSNPYYHFVEVLGTNSEFIEIDKWCQLMFGDTDDRTWWKDVINEEPFVKLHLKLKRNPNYDRVSDFRYRFAKAEHREWFILRWS